MVQLVTEVLQITVFQMIKDICIVKDCTDPISDFFPLFGLQLRCICKLFRRIVQNLFSQV